MIVGCAQIACVPGDVRGNCHKIQEFTTIAAGKGCEVIIFPEMVDTGYDMSLLTDTASAWDLANPQSPIAILIKTAAVSRATILCGLSERVGDLIYNSTAVFDPDHGLVASYRKSHLAAYPLFNEQKFITPGDTLTRVEIGTLKWGLEICYDLRFPEISRAHALGGAEVLAFGSAWPFPRLEHWLTLTRARAIENQSYVVAANRVGCDGGPTFCGASAIIDPYGVIVSRASADREELIVGEISRKVIDTTRAGIPVFDHRRPEMYQTLSLSALVFGGLMRFVTHLILILSMSLPAIVTAESEDVDLAEYIRFHYSKFEYKVPMRDGVELFTVVYLPNDASQQKTYPILLARSPYSVDPYGADRYAKSFSVSEELAREGFIFVMQDVRGRFMSEGEFINMRPHLEDKNGPNDVDESTDTYDAVEWLITHTPHNNKRVGIWGNSYLGFYTSAGIIDTHPAIKAAMPSAPIADWYFDDMHHNGAFSLNLTFNFFSSFGVVREGLTTQWPERFDHKTPDGYQFFLDLGPLSTINERHFHHEIPFWDEITNHPDYDDFWQTRNILPHLKNISCAVLTVGGLFDAEDLYGPWHTYSSIESHNPGINNTIVIGPWSHGAWLRDDGRTLGDADFGFATGTDFRDRILVPFFRHHLKGAEEPQLPEAMVFETGANRWRSFDQWPPASLEKSTLYLGIGGRVGWEPSSTAIEATAEFISDPAKPVPYTTEITTGWYKGYMTEDQRFAARRPDVLVFRSAPLTQDLTLAGPFEAELWVSTTGTDADWVVKLIDEFPGRLEGYDPKSEEKDLGGTQRLVRSEIFRGRYRNALDRPEPFVPGEPTRVVVPLQGILHTFKRGHRIMIQVQSSLFPFFDRNPQTFVANIFEAEETDFVKATHRIYLSGEHQSTLHIGVLSGQAGLLQDFTQ